MEKARLLSLECLLLRPLEISRTLPANAQDKRVRTNIVVLDFRTTMTVNTYSMMTAMKGGRYPVFHVASSSDAQYERTRGSLQPRRASLPSDPPI